MLLNRRAALKTLGLSAGATFLAPILARLEAQAAGRPVTAKRFVFVVESNGVPPDQLAPVGIKRSRREQRPLNGPSDLLDVALADKDLPFSLEPVKAWKDKHDPIANFAAKLEDVDLDALDEQATQRIDAAVEFAEESDFPSAESIYDHVYVTGGQVRG